MLGRLLRRSARTPDVSDQETTQTSAPPPLAPVRPPLRAPGIDGTTRRFKPPFRSRRINLEEVSTQIPYHETRDGKMKIRKMRWAVLSSGSLGFFAVAAILL